MPKRIRLEPAIMVVLLVAGAAQAQTPIVMTSWSFTEVYAGTNTPVMNPNGVIEPGEAARIELTVSFEPAVGTPLPQGTVAGLFGLTCDLVGSNMAEGMWSHLERREGWAVGDVGFPSPDGTAVRYIMVGQFPQAGATANPENPIEKIWWGVWTPDMYDARATVFQGMHTSPPPTSSSASLMVQNGVGPGGEPLYGVLNAQVQFGGLQIPVVPSPATAAVLGAAGLLTARRRRSEETV
jgi:hypothetical protein